MFCNFQNNPSNNGRGAWLEYKMAVFKRVSYHFNISSLFLFFCTHVQRKKEFGTTRIWNKVAFASIFGTFQIPSLQEVPSPSSLSHSRSIDATGIDDLFTASEEGETVPTRRICLGNVLTFFMHSILGRGIGGWKKKITPSVLVFVHVLLVRITLWNMGPYH